MKRAKKTEQTRGSGNKRIKQRNTKYEFDQNNRIK